MLHMSFIHHIQSVARYESKILLRSWFFKVFTVLAVLILGIFNFVVGDDGNGFWLAKAVPSNIPYLNLLLLNTGQAVIAIFLSSEFLKRDKKLDTSEVFYVRPLSNAEYVIGKIWGNLRVFIVLNFIVMAETMLITWVAIKIPVDLLSYLTYFFLISLPTLVFIIGLSIFLMLVLKNQALTFILLLGYIGLTLFYITDKFYYMFDYMAYNLPMFKSTIVGFTHIGLLLNHRGIYLFAGLAFIFFTIFLFKRLPNSSRSSYPWIILSICMLLVSGWAGYRHVSSILDSSELRTFYTAINNKYVNSPKMVIEKYDISVEQQPESFSSVARMQGRALQTSSVFTFCLNPGLQVEEVRSGDKKLDFKRDNQIILVDFGKDIVAGDTTSFSVSYAGKIDPDFCYLDIPDEVLQEQYQKDMINIDKQYVFQTSDYVLFTPETYWYPRPGTAYSDQEPLWQQTFFSRFKLAVKPLPGLVPISQGEAVKKEDVYTFSPDYPFQAISLVIGKYEQKSIESDSTSYQVWYIQGNGYFTAEFDSILDTIPSLIRDMREGLERSYKLTYPFDRFSVVEVPAQFASYTRSWSQAQETVQPQMVLFPEKGCTLYQLDVESQKKNQIRWSKWNGREISEVEAQIRVVNNILSIFSQTSGDYNFSSGGRGQYKIQRRGNPYFLFPQLYNFRYNIFSPEWPIANRVIELYLQKLADTNGWEREINGISNSEKANLLMKEQSFKELLGDVKHRELLNNIMALKGNWMFAVPEINLGVDVFRDSLYSVLERNTFRNVQFEHLLDTLGAISGTDLNAQLLQWNKLTPLPHYTIGRPVVTKITNRSEEAFILKLLVCNNSDYDGIIQLNIAIGRSPGKELDPRTKRKIFLPAHQTQELVSVWEDAPRDVTVNTLISENLPNEINLPVGTVAEEKDREIEKEGDFVVPVSSLTNGNEIIVDNEDSLFLLSAPAMVGLLPKWLDKVGDTSFKYAGVSSWRPPLQWTATTNEAYYGQYIRSAYVIKSGDGSQTATWKIPVVSEGQYDVYYYVSKDNEVKYNKHAEGEYHFKVEYGDEREEVYLDIKKADEGWSQLGAYFFSSDTVRIVLSNDCKLRSVTADAVKVVKRY